MPHLSDEVIRDLTEFVNSHEDLSEENLSYLKAVIDGGYGS